MGTNFYKVKQAETPTYIVLDIDYDNEIHVFDEEAYEILKHFQRKHLTGIPINYTILKDERVLLNKEQTEIAFLEIMKKLVKLKLATEIKDYEGDHIGKRSAAGQYCWDCGITLNIYGEFYVHSDIEQNRDYGGITHINKANERWGNNKKFFNNPSTETVYNKNTQWFKKCPTCGKPIKDYTSLSKTSAGIELGFKQPEKIKPKGVQSVSSFSWAMIPFDLIEYAKESKAQIIDEYGRRFTVNQFRKMINNNCPIQYFRSVGTEFC